MTTRTVTIRKMLEASCEEIFDAWLDAEGMSAWMRPAPGMKCHATLEPRVGGRFRIVMTTPGAEFVNIGQYLELDRPHKIQFTWIASRWSNAETVVTVELRSVGGQCELTLTHDRFPMDSSTQALVKGWNRILENLAANRTRMIF